LGRDPRESRSDPSSVSRRLLSSTIANYIGQFVTLATGFFLTPFVLHQLGPTHYGLWVLIGSIAAYGTLLDFGIWGAVVKYVAEYRARGELAYAHNLVATALIFYVIMGLAAATLSIAIAPLIPGLFQITDQDRETAVWLAVLSGLSVGVSIPSVTAIAVLHGLQRFDLVNLLTVTGTLLVAAATVVVLLLGGGVLGMTAVAIPLTLLMQIPSIWLVNRIAPELHFGWRGARMSAVRPIVSFSSSLFVMQLAWRLQTKTDEVVIGAFLPVSSVTPYALAHRLSEVITLLGGQSTKAMMPLASQLDAGSEWGRLRALYVASSRLILALATLVSATVVMLAGPLLTVWVGAAYVDSAHLVTILTVASLIEVSQMPAISLLQGSARHRPLAAMAAGAAIANLVLSLILVRSLGVAGVALGTLIPEAVVSFGFVLPYATRTMGVSAWTVVRDMWLPALLPAIPLAITLYGFQLIAGLESLPTLLIAAAVGSAVYVTAYLVVGCRGEERRLFSTLVALARVRIRKALAQL
jgi:O-antigen/teichoic acid export membrane protein